jgi:type II secretory pathway component GspD/PulD (secretin)
VLLVALCFVLPTFALTADAREGRGTVEVFREMEEAFAGDATVVREKLQDATVAVDALQQPIISVNFNRTPLKDAITAISMQSGVNIIIDRTVDPSTMVTAVYAGVSLEEAFDVITTGADLAFTKRGNIYVISGYKERLFDVNKLFLATESVRGTVVETDMMMGADATGAGGMAGGGMGGVAGGGMYGGTEMDFGGYITFLIENLQKMLSPNGIITYMPSGFIYVKDAPSRVRAIESALNLDDSKREEINLRISLVRVDLRDEKSTGVDWSSILGRVRLGSGPKKEVELGINFPGIFQPDNVATVVLRNALGDIRGIFNMLGEYGDVHIVHSWETRALAGTVLPFELTQSIWYTRGETVQVVEGQTITSPIIESDDVGVKILLRPLLQNDGRFLLNAKVDISNIVGFQMVGDIELPQTERNFVKVPIKMHRNDTAIISGFKVKTKDISRKGVPFLSNLPILKHIFGTTSEKERTSEFSVIISIDGEDSIIGQNISKKTEGGR